MILLAGGILYAEKAGLKKILLKRDWWLLIIGSIVVIIAYIEDFVSFLLNDYSFGELIKVIYNEEVIEKSLTYIPLDFAWFVFIAGITFHAMAITNVFIRSIRN